MAFSKIERRLLLARIHGSYVQILKVSESRMHSSLIRTFTTRTSVMQNDAHKTVNRSIAHHGVTFS